VAQALRVNSTLMSLDLSHCGLTDMGGAQIALSLADNRCETLAGNSTNINSKQSLSIKNTLFAMPGN